MRDTSTGSSWVPAVVAGCAVVAGLARVPAIGWSMGPDESGFTLVARTWHPASDSPFGHYWVDRPPALIALVRLTDAVGGVHGIRWVAAVGSALLVLAAAGVAREVARWATPAAVGRSDAGPHGGRSDAGAAAASAGGADAVGAAGRSDAPRACDRAVVLTAVGTTALVSNAAIDLVFAKGEVLALPFLVGSMWLLLRAVRTRSALLSAVAGLLAGSALGLKQNLVDGLVFAVVVLVGEALRRTVGPRDLTRLGVAFVVAAALPAVLTIAWAASAGVRLSALWYAVYGFRGDAFDVILAGPIGAPLRRAVQLAEVAVVTGLAVLFLWFLLSLRRLGRERPVLTLATVVVLAVDGVSLALGGSYWRPYLFELVPPAVLALALLTSATPAPAAARRSPARVVTGAVVALLVVSSVVTGLRWAQSWPSQGRPTTGVAVGRAIHAASQPGDTLTVWGGQANVQLASGLDSPYAYLWSLPARTRDPGSADLAAVLAGGDAPTWFLAWSGLDDWHDGTAAIVGPVLEQRYVRVGAACGGHPLYRLRQSARPVPRVSCRDVARARATTSP